MVHHDSHRGYDVHKWALWTLLPQDCICASAEISIFLSVTQMYPCLAWFVVEYFSLLSKEAIVREKNPLYEPACQRIGCISKDAVANVLSTNVLILLWKYLLFLGQIPQCRQTPNSGTMQAARLPCINSPKQTSPVIYCPTIEYHPLW